MEISYIDILKKSIWAPKIVLGLLLRKSKRTEITRASVAQLLTAAELTSVFLATQTL